MELGQWVEIPEMDIAGWVVGYVSTTTKEYKHWYSARFGEDAGIVVDPAAKVALILNDTGQLEMYVEPLVQMLHRPVLRS